MAAGQDRIDSHVPLPRSPGLLAFAAWSMSDLTRQHDGEPPTPWPGPV